MTAICSIHSSLAERYNTFSCNVRNSECFLTSTSSHFRLWIRLRSGLKLDYSNIFKFVPLIYLSVASVGSLGTLSVWMMNLSILWSTEKGFSENFPEIRNLLRKDFAAAIRHHCGEDYLILYCSVSDPVWRASSSIHCFLLAGASCWVGLGGTHNCGLIVDNCGVLQDFWADYAAFEGNWWHRI